MESDSDDPGHETEETGPNHSEAFIEAETLMSWLEKQNESSQVTYKQRGWSQAGSWPSRNAASLPHILGLGPTVRYNDILYV
ncbi:hypothetical protein J6590_091981 [Homalodisca vitripennis]|nr:hypothetical protein J6590_091981 [Homalodisca vitripennis]